MLASGGVAALCICFFGYTFITAPNELPKSNQQNNNSSIQDAAGMSTLSGDETENAAIAEPDENAANTESEATNPDPAESTEKTSFTDGTQLVGIDIAAGTYESTNPTPACNYEKLSGESTSNGKLNISTSGNNAKKKVSITIGPNDTALTTTGCGTWKKVN